MQITLNIDSANIGGTVEQVFATLSDEDKKQLAKDVMLEVLRKPQAAERQVFEKQVVDSLIAEFGNDSYHRIDTAEKARSHYKFRERMDKFKSTTDRMMEMITASAISNYKSMVDALVKEDPQTQDMLNTVRDQFISDMPKLIQMTMATYFASQMNGISQAMLSALNANTGVQMLGANLKSQLASQGIHIGG